MKKLFTSDRFFLMMVLFAVLGNAVGAVLTWTKGIAIFYSLQLLWCVVCVIVLYISYKKHSKNVMKGMMGALLMAQVFYSTSLFLSNVDTEYIVYFSVYLVATIILFINHFVINSNRHPSSILVLINQISVAVIAIDMLLFDIININLFGAVASIADVIGVIGLASSIVCVESRLDAYRLDREAAGWTEEAGYPEGYVHEYQKRK